MVLAIINNSFHYEMEKLSMAFYPETKIQVVHFDDLTNPELTHLIYEHGCGVYVNISKDEKIATVTYENRNNDISISKKNIIDNYKNAELVCAKLLYDVLSQATGVYPSWGVLTGVRPSKLMHSLISERGEEAAKSYFTDDLLVSPGKVELAASVAKAEQKIMMLSRPESFSLYISIPFCPGRCSYCSFVSSAVNTPSAKKLIPEYFEKLLFEIRRSAELSKQVGIHMLSGYVGGGTPSILTAEQTDRLLKTVNASFDMSNCKEFTFEAGRPDTITSEKLAAVLENGVDRISINPQTMSDDVLKAVGRHHSVEQVYDAYSAARKLGFKNINMDLIAGLPTDTPHGFSESIHKIIDLEPESITVHTLSYKRSSDLNFEDGLFSHGKETALMVDIANETLYKNGYIPYYMYRQTKSVGNLENVGWCKPGFESSYNIYMMEECHTILACGAGAVTKLKAPASPEIQRIFNFKYPYEYNDRFEELLKRKDALVDFYARRNNGTV